MILALIVMLSSWGLAVLVKKYWLKDCGKFLAIIFALVIAITAALLQGLISATLNQNAGIVTDGMGYVRNSFLTLCILLYVIYITLRSKT